MDSIIESEIEVCTCGCHDPKNGMMHFAPCCDRCEYCKQQIKISSLPSHRERCRKAFEAREASDRGDNDVSHVDTGQDLAG